MRILVKRTAFSQSKKHSNVLLDITDILIVDALIICFKDGHNASLNLSKVAGIFYILMGGMIASMIAALGEFLYRSRIEARKGNVGSLVGCLAVRSFSL